MSLRSDYVTIKVLFFAKAREYIGKSEAPVEVPRVILGKDLLNFITEKFKLGQLKCNVILALNESWIDLNADHCLRDSDVVAVIPPLSGARYIPTIPTENTEAIQLYEEVVEAEPGNEVSPHLIQINANLQEINRRINSFINRKREQINANNIQDFCSEKSKNPDESSCARVSAVLSRRKDSTSHLKVHRVENYVGPQTHGFDTRSYSPSRECSFGTLNCPPGAEERLENVERYLNMSQSSRDVFSRLKAIEDRILYLESISPEYFDFDREEKPARKPGNFPSKRTYSSSELELKVHQLEAKLQKKSNTNV